MRPVPLRRIAAHEWRVLRADGILATVIVLFAAALIWGLVTGVRSQTTVAQGLETAVTEEAERYGRLADQLGQREDAIARGETRLPGDPRAASSLSGRGGARAATMPVLPTAALSVGQSDLLPSALRVSSEPREQMLAVSEIENPHRLLEGRFDVSFVLTALLPLLILALSYNLLAAEREQGTLALLLSQPVALSRVVLAKVGVRLAWLLIIALLVVTLGLLAMGVSPGDPGVWWRLAGWSAVVFAYSVFWFAVAVALGSLGRSSAATALSCAAVWLVCVVVVPSLANLAVNAWYPVPSRVAMVQAMREASDEASARGSVLLAQYFEDHPEMAPVVGVEQTANFQATRVAVAAEVARLVAPVVARYDEQLARQRDAINWMRFLSPAVLARESFDDLAGTGQHRHAHFVAQVDAFHEGWQTFFTPRIVSRATLASLDDVPVFRYEEERASRVVARLAVSVGAMLLVALLLAVFGVRAMRRYPISA